MLVGCPSGYIGITINLAVPADLSVSCVIAAVDKIKDSGMVPMLLVVNPDMEEFARDVLNVSNNDDGIVIATDSDKTSGYGWIMVGK